MKSLFPPAVAGVMLSMRVDPCQAFVRHSHRGRVPIQPVSLNGRQGPFCSALLLLSTETRMQPEAATAPFVLWSAIRDDGSSSTLNRRRTFIISTLALWMLPSTALLYPKAATAKDLKEEYRQGTAALSGMDDQAPVPREAYKKLPSGVVYADLRSGQGTNTVQTGSKVNIQWVLRKSNGYFVDSSERNDSVPFIWTVGDGTAIAGLEQAVRGMQEGGVRRILIPPALAYVDGLRESAPGPLPYGFGPRQQLRRVQEVRANVPGEYLCFEVQVTRLR